MSSRGRGPETWVSARGFERGTGSRAAPIQCRTARGRQNASRIRHSEGRKVAGDTSLWKCCNPDTMAKVVDRARCSPIPILAALPLYCDARGIANLDPGRTRTGSLDAVGAFRDDALGAKPTRMLEHRRA